jgi:aspartate racemase
MKTIIAATEVITRKKLGIVGGMGARAGILFMQKIIDYSPVNRDQDFIEVVLHSNAAVPDRTRAILYNEPSPEAELIRSVGSFDRYNIEALVLACITAYYYYDALQQHTNANILHPVKILLEHLHTTHPGVGRIGVLASTGAIKAGIFHRLCEPAGLEVTTLDATAQETQFMQSLYMPGGLKSAVISDDARQLFFDAVAGLRQKQVDLIVGGCSEVSILLNQDVLDIPYVDIMDLLARETVRYCYGLS